MPGQVGSPGTSGDRQGCGQSCVPPTRLWAPPSGRGPDRGTSWPGGHTSARLCPPPEAVSLLPCWSPANSPVHAPHPRIMRLWRHDLCPAGLWGSLRPPPARLSGRGPEGPGPVQSVWVGEGHSARLPLSRGFAGSCCRAPPSPPASRVPWRQQGLRKPPSPHTAADQPLSVALRRPGRLPSTPDATGCVCQEHKERPDEGTAPAFPRPVGPGRGPRGRPGWPGGVSASVPPSLPSSPVSLGGGLLGLGGARLGPAGRALGPRQGGHVVGGGGCTWAPALVTGGGRAAAHMTPRLGGETEATGHGLCPIPATHPQPTGVCGPGQVGLVARGPQGLGG